MPDTGATDRYYIEMIMKGQERVLQKLDAISGKLGQVASAMERMSGTMASGGQSVRKAGNEIEKTGKKARGFSGNILNMTSGMKGVIVTGMLMSIGWQAINGVLTTVTGAMHDLVFAGAELETQMVSLNVISANTGKSLDDTLSMINRQIDGLTERTAVSKTTLKLLSTSLSIDQIETFIERVKDGSAAMGEQSNVQLPMLASGFRRLNANVLDNIGVNLRLDKVQQRAARGMGISVKALTNAQIEQAIFNEILKQTDVFTGAYAAQLDTAAGSMERMGIEWQQFAQNVSDTGPLRVAADAFNNWMSGVNNALELMKRFEAAGFDMEIAHNAMTGAQIGQTRALEGMIQKLIEVEAAQAEAKRIEEERIMVLLQATEVYKRLTSEIGKQNDIQLKLGRSMKEMEDVMTGYDDEINLLLHGHQELIRAFIDTGNANVQMITGVMRATDGLFFMQQQLSLASDELDIWGDALKSAESFLKPFEREFEKLDKILNPEKYEDVGDAFSNISRELSTAQNEQQRASDALLKRVEPVIYKKRLQEESEATKKVSELTVEEIQAKTDLQTRVSELQNILSGYTHEVDGNAYSIEQLNIKVEDATRTKETWEGKIKDARREVGLLKEENWFLQQSFDDLEEKLDDDVIPALDDLNKELERIQKNSKQTIEIDYIIQNYSEGYSFAKPSRINPYTGRAYQAGGFVSQTGMYMLHQGERVATALDTREQNVTNNNNRNVSIGSGAIVINPPAGSDPQEIGRVLERYVSTELLRRQAI